LLGFDRYETAVASWAAEKSNVVDVVFVVADCWCTYVLFSMLQFWLSSLFSAIFCTYPLLLRTMKRSDPFQDIVNRVKRCRDSLPQCTAIGNTHTSTAPTAMGPTVAMGLNEAPVVPGFATGAFACASSSCEASGGTDEPQSGATSTTTGLTFIALTALAIEAGVSPEDPMMPRLPRLRVEIESESDGDESRYCHICVRWLNGPEQYDEHLQKPMHNKRLLKKPKTYAGENCEQSPCPISL
jgi:hypothetical protein